MVRKIVFTGQYFRLGEYRKIWGRKAASRQQILKAVAVSNSVPRGYEKIEKFGKLIPDWRLVDEYKRAEKISAATRDRYAHRYEVLFKRYLLTLDVEEVFDELTEGNTVYPVLLCWEREDFICHRHWIADWFEHFGLPAGEFNLK